MDLGLERAGMECVAQVEYDPWCQRVLEKHWPNVPRWSDIRDVNPEELPDHDLIAGGFPCQPVSLAGTRLAQDDERWLWPEFFRIVRMVRPRFVLVENVPGLASAGMGDVLGDLASIGYDSEWQSIPAAFVGAPHLRWRIFIVAYPNEQCRSGNDERNARVSGTEVSETESGGRVVRRTGSSSDVAYPNGQAPHHQQTIHTPIWGTRPTRTRNGKPGPLHDRWAVEPDVGRVANGVPNRVDRLRGLGNAVVPQVAELVGRAIMNTSIEIERRNF